MQTEQKRAWLTGAQIKWIAMIVMVIDHMAAVFIEPILMNTVVSGMNYDYVRKITDIYMVLRGIGRFAFPAFCFLLVEGFYHTRNKAKYLRNLMIFAFISEIPFDLALYDKMWYWEHQNVFFTLAAGFLAIWIANYFILKSMTDLANAFIFKLAAVASVIGIALLTEAMHTDYGAVGVATIFVLYAMYNKPVMSAVAAWIVLGMTNVLELWSFPFIGAVYFYNGERGRQNKYFFYIFYPAHLLLLMIFKMIIFK